MQQIIFSFIALFSIASVALANGPQENELLSWTELPALPDKLGVAGPFAGVHNDALVVAGGTNFSRPVWENGKTWHDHIFVLTRNGDEYDWKDGGRLARPTAYGAAVSTTDGIVCMGGNDSENTLDDVFLMRWDANSGKINTTPYPPLPKPCAFGAAALVGQVIYLAGGQSGQSLETAMDNFWSLDLSMKDDPSGFVWKKREPWPGATRALNLTVHQHNGNNDCVYVISGRRQDGDRFDFLRDVWEYTPTSNRWRRRQDAPQCLMAGTAIGYGQSHILVLGGATERLFFKTNELKDDHPGFGKKSLAYHTITDTWTTAGTTPSNHVTTIAVKWDDAIIIPSGEVRPRVRSPKVWQVRPTVANRGFGAANYLVPFGDLLHRRSRR